MAITGISVLVQKCSSLQAWVAEGEEAGADDSLRAMSAIAQALLGARNALQGEQAHSLPNCLAANLALTAHDQSHTVITAK